MTPQGRTRARAAYIALAVHTLNTLIVLLAINAGLFVYYRARDRRSTPTMALPQDLRRLTPAYPGWSVDEIAALVRTQPAISYEPLTQYRHRPLRSRYVNISPDGFRFVARQAAWPPDPRAFNVFFFGGSTTYGSLLPDGETIPSFFQERANQASRRRKVVVYNFGRSNFFSIQERALLERLLLSGAKPDLAIFIDGLNDFALWTGEPAYTRQLERNPGFSEPGARVSGPPSRIPLLRAAEALRRRLLHEPEDNIPELDAGAPPPNDQASLRTTRRKWVDNRRCIRAVCREFGIRCLFVWQPVPTYHFDLHRHLLYPGDMRYFRLNQRSAYGYPLMAARRAALERDGDFLWLADIQQETPGVLYIDSVHYTAGFSRVIAGRIVAFARNRGILSQAGNIPTQNPGNT